MPAKLLIPVEYLDIDAPDVLPSANHAVDMPKLPDFKRASEPTATEVLNKIRPGHSQEPFELLKSPPFIWPVIGIVSSGYGFRTNETKGGTTGGVHSGIDIPMPAGAPIMAARGGVVKRADNVLRGYGNLVIIDHGNKVETRYAHCSAFAVKKGDIVTTGQIIAYVGNSGNSTSDHLHFEVVINDLPYDPMRFLGGYRSALTNLSSFLLTPK
ncbi:MAG: M23 family metallopeptidase [Synergistaceae bacterium]|nr:M23 family metallopeptidase [Synergistaceae bacterium]